MLSAVAGGTLSQQVVEEIRVEKTSIHGIAKGLKDKTDGRPTHKPRPKSSGWQTLISAFSTAIRRVIKRDAQR